MSDWEVISVNKKKPKKQESHESEWEVSQSEQPESDWETYQAQQPSMETKGFGGIASDAYNKAIDTVSNIPGQILNLPGELYGAGKQVVTDPKRALQNVGAGFGELGHGILSAPGNIRDYLQKKDIVSENSPGFRLPESVLPKEYNYGEALGAEGEHPGDSILRGIPKGAALGPLSKLAPYVSSGLSKAAGKVIPEGPYHFIQKAYDKKEKALSNIFSDVSKQANEANIKINLPKNLINEIKKSGPKTEKFNTFVDKSKAGNYDSLRKLQSELFTRGKNYSKSQLASENDFGAHLFEQRAKLNDAIIKSLENAGRPDLAGKLTEARHGWKNLEELYHSNPTISKLIGDEREVPLTFNTLRKESSYIKNLKEEHPEIDKKLKMIRRAQQISAAIAGLGIKKILTGNNKSYNDYND